MRVTQLLFRLAGIAAWAAAGAATSATTAKTAASTLLRMDRSTDTPVIPQSAPLTDLAGVIHLHSLYSDGTGTVQEIARAGEANGLDFVLLTDHDTLEARDRGEEGWHGKVLLLVGEEVSPKGQDHFLAFGSSARSTIAG